jgi:hypothetical protein
MRPVDKPHPPYPPRLHTRAGVAREPLEIVRTALQDTIGSYCSFCEMPIYVEEGVASKRRRTFHETPRLDDWDDLLLTCDWCRYYRTGDAENLDDFLWPDTGATFTLGAASPFVYSLREVDFVATDESSNVVGIDRQSLIVVSANPAVNDRRAQNTIDLFRLNSPFYDEAAGRFTVSKAESIGDNRPRLRMRAWRHAQKSIDALRKSMDDPIAYAGMAPLVASLAQASGFWSVWMTELWAAFGDPKIIRDTLLWTSDGRRYDFYGYQTVPDGGKPPWKLFSGTALDRIAFEPESRG